MKKLLIAGLAITLTACGQQADTNTETTAAPSAAANVPVIGVMNLPNLDSYCAFFPAGHKFDFNNPATWQFVFADHIGDPEEKADIMIDGDKRTFKPSFQNIEGGIHIRQYESIDLPKVRILLEMEEGEQGMESTNFEGTLSVIRTVKDDYPEIYEESTVKFYGDCGV